MNIFQRIILILGAILLTFTVWTSQINLFLAIKGITVLGATLLIFYALKGIKKRKIANPEEMITISRETLNKLMETAIENKKELLEALERERIRDKYLDKIGK